MQLAPLFIFGTLLYYTLANPTSIAIFNTDSIQCPCTNDSSSSLTAETKTRIKRCPPHHGMTCMCHNGITHEPQVIREDFQYSLNIGAHKLHVRANTWDEARKTCMDEGAHLAVINSRNESLVLQAMFKKSMPIRGAAAIDVVFIGMHDLYQEGEWVTVTGESLLKAGYTNWSPKYGGQPDDEDGTQNCGGFFSDGGLDDLNCSTHHAFFCELPMIYTIY